MRIKKKTQNSIASFFHFFFSSCPWTIQWPCVFSGLQLQVPIQLCCRVRLGVSEASGTKLVHCPWKRKGARTPKGWTSTCWFAEGILFLFYQQ